MKLFIVIILIVFFLGGCERAKLNIELSRKIDAVDLIVEKNCSVKPLVASQYANEKLLFVKLTFHESGKLTCNNKELADILDSFLLAKVGYSNNSGLYVEKFINNEYVMEQVR